MRLFIAVPLPDTSRIGLSRTLSLLSVRYSGVKWVSSSGIHITLIFLGDCSEQVYSKVKGKLQDNPYYGKPFSAGFSGLSQFPPKGKPSVYIIPAIEGEEDFKNLHRHLYALLAADFALDSRPFTPHITLGRVKVRNQAPGAGALGIMADCSFLVDRFILYKSELHPKGALYTPLQEYLLKEKSFSGNS